MLTECKPRFMFRHAITGSSETVQANIIISGLRYLHDTVKSMTFDSASESVDSAWIVKALA